MKIEVSIKRIAAIISCMYGQGAELVNDIGNEECYIFRGMKNNRLPVDYEEFLCLLDHEIIEFDSGCDEEDRETEVYRLTEKAQEKMQEFIKSRKAKTLLLKQ